MRAGGQGRFVRGGFFWLGRCLVAQGRTRGAGIILNMTQQEHVGLELRGFGAAG